MRTDKTTKDLQRGPVCSHVMAPTDNRQLVYLHAPDPGTIGLRMRVCQGADGENGSLAIGTRWDGEAAGGSAVLGREKQRDDERVDTLVHAGQIFKAQTSGHVGHSPNRSMGRRMRGGQRDGFQYRFDLRRRRQLLLE